MNKTPYAHPSQHPDVVFRRSHKTIQGIATLLSYIAIFVFWRNLSDINTASLCIGVLLSSFVIGRTLFKRNRGIARMFNGEALTLVLMFVWILYAIKVGCNRSEILVIGVSHLAIFNFCRGISDSVPCRTMFINR